MKPANYAPLYVGLYPELAEICRKHGYALAVHGSLARDFDLIAVPWAPLCSVPEAVINEITATYALQLIGEEGEEREHGRIAFTLALSFKECFIDFSFMPTQEEDIGSIQHQQQLCAGRDNSPAEAE